MIGGKHALAAAEQKIRAAVAGSSIEITGSFWYGGEASVENMDRLMEQDAVRQSDMLFAIGGGKAIDTCKVIAHRTDGPFSPSRPSRPPAPPVPAWVLSIIPMDRCGNMPSPRFRRHMCLSIPKSSQRRRSGICGQVSAIPWQKFYECTVSSRNDVPRHSDAMGIALSAMCAAPILRWGRRRWRPAIRNL